MRWLRLAGSVLEVAVVLGLYFLHGRERLRGIHSPSAPRDSQSGSRFVREVMA